MPRYVKVPIGIPEIGDLVRIVMKGDPVNDRTAYDGRVVSRATGVDGQAVMKVSSVQGNQPSAVRETDHDVYLVR